jgi:hypothetical protein
VKTSSNSKRATGLQLRYRELPQAPQDLGDEEVRVCAADFETIDGYPAEKHRLRPWKNCVVRISTDTGSVFRLLKGHGTLSIRQGDCWIGPRTRSQLDAHDGTTISVSVAEPRSIARLLYHNNHPNEAVRLNFRFGLSLVLLATAAVLLRNSRKSA